MKTRKAFDLAAELPRAWDWCWNYYCEETEYRECEYDDDGCPKKDENGERIYVKAPRMIPARQSWLTATDLERRLRARAVEVQDGLEYGAAGQDGLGSGIRIVGGNGYSLLDTVRGWLRGQALDGKLTAHNFGKGHISGMRYRPAGMELTESEKKTKAKKEKAARGETLVHYRATPTGAWKPLCVAGREVKRRAMYRAPKRSSARMTMEAESVTCPRCRKLLAEAAGK